MRFASCSLLAAVFLGCSSNATVPADAGGADAVSAADSGADAIVPFVPTDAGPTGGPILPTDPCDDVASSLYAAPSGLPAFDASVRGVLLGCASLGTISSAELATRLSGVPGLVRTGGAVRIYLIRYRTEREPRGVGGISTALVYLPEVAISERVPMVLVAHGSVGIADVCAPSRTVVDGLGALGLPASYVDPLLLSFAARGFPVVVPDYAGLGTEGTHDYGNWFDPARSAVDGVRALRSLLPAARLDGGTLVYGHSQGGGVALTVAALASEAPDVQVRAIVAAAPGYRIAPLATVVAMDTFAVTPLLRAIGATTVYAGYANLTTDTAAWRSPFAPGVRDFLASELDTHCLVQQQQTLAEPSAGYTPPATVGEIFDPAFRSAVATCAGGGACDGLPGMWTQRDAANDPHLPASSPPVLLIGSTTDTSVPPGVLGCAVTSLRADTVTPDTCVVAAGEHLEMVPATMEYAIEWALAARDGTRRPPCPGSTRAPGCNPFAM